MPLATTPVTPWLDGALVRHASEIAALLQEFGLAPAQSLTSSPEPAPAQQPERR